MPPDKADGHAATPSNGPALLFTSLMTLTAGFVDAIGYGNLAGLYLSFMSGNATQLGVALAGGNFEIVSQAAAIVALFVTGAALGTAIVDRAGRFTAPIIYSAEAAAFAIALAGGWAGLRPATLTVLAIAMGMQNVLQRKLWGAEVGRGFVTGTLFNLGQSIARLGRPGMFQAGMVLLFSWGLFVAGAALGAVALARLGLEATLVLGLCVLAGLSAASLVVILGGRHAV